nr:retrovirus-related Pol polyprotein from transposon TNT 1-94 [Tanacetum cinerariifolium]
GEYDLWKMRMEQYLQCIDYTLWEIIENGNAPIVIKIVDGKDTVIPPTSVEEKAQRKAEMKARSTLLMALPNEHQLKLQNPISQLEMHGEVIPQEEINQKLLRSLSQDWTMHTIVWRNKLDIETLSLDDLFNNLKAYKSELDNKDLQQIHPDDLKEMDLRWNIVMLTMRARRFLKNTGKKLDMANKERIRFDKSKVECFNCHKGGHFARECRAPRNQDRGKREPIKKIVPVEATTSNALVMYKRSKDLKEQNEQLVKDLRTARISDVSYKTGLESIEARLDLDITELKRKLELAIKENDESGNFMPPKPDLVYPSLDDFVDVNESVSEYVVEKPIVESNEPKTVRKENGAPIIEDWVSESKEEDEPKFQTVNPNFTKIVFVKPKTNRKPVKQIRSLRNQESRPKNQDSSRKTMIMEDTSSKAMVAIDGAGSQITDNSKTGLGFTSYNVAAPLPTGLFSPSSINLSNCGLEEFQHPEFKGYGRKDIPIGTARQSSSRAAAPVSAARPINTVPSKPLVNIAKPRQNALQTTHSLSMRPFYQQTALKNRNLNNNVNATKANSVNTTKGNKVTSVVGNQGINAVKSSACWVWRSKTKVQDYVFKNSGSYICKRFDYGTLQDALKDQGYFDSRCSRHMTRNISYLTDFKKHDGGYVAFGEGAKGGKITGKGTIRTVNTACYVQNRVLVVKPYFKTPYELFKGRSPALSFMRPFRCHVSILNTLEQLGKFDRKSDEGIFVGYSTTSKAFKVYNIRTKKVEKNLHITFLENKPMIAGGGPELLFDLDALLKLMNYAPVFAGTNSNDCAGKGESFDASQSSMETRSSQDYILMLLWKDNSLFDSSSQASDSHNKYKHGPSQASETDYPNDPHMPDLEDAGIFDDDYDDRDEGAEADYNNLATVISVSPIPSTRIHKDHPKEHIIGEVNSAVHARKMAKQTEARLISFINK